MIQEKGVNINPPLKGLIKGGGLSLIMAGIIVIEYVRSPFDLCLYLIKVKRSRDPLVYWLVFADLYFFYIIEKIFRV